MAKIIKEIIKIINDAHKEYARMLPRLVSARNGWKEKAKIIIEIIRRIKATGAICKKNNQNTFFPSVWY